MTAMASTTPLTTIYTEAARTTAGASLAVAVFHDLVYFRKFRQQTILFGRRRCVFLLTPLEGTFFIFGIHCFTLIFHNVYFFS
jgi:hypothetical protein